MNIPQSGLQTQRFLNEAKATQQYGQQNVHDLADHICRSDELADQVVDDFQQLPAGKGWELINKALENINALDNEADLPESFHHFLDQARTVPDWVDWSQIRRGAIAYWRPGLLTGLALRCASLAAGYRSAAAAKPLLFTGRLIDKASTRASETSVWVLAATTPDAMKPGNEGWKQTVRVRLIHAFVRRRLMNLKEWNFEAWGLPINITDTAYGISGEFSSVVVQALSDLGIKYSTQEKRDLYQLWRYVGYVLGVPEVILHRNEEQALCQIEIKEITDTPADEGSRQLVRSLVENGGSVEDIVSGMSKYVSDKLLQKVLYGYIRFFAGNAVADELAIPDTPWKYLGYATKALVSAQEFKHRLFKTDLETLALGNLDKIRSLLTQSHQQHTLADTQEIAQDIKANQAKFKSSAQPVH